VGMALGMLAAVAAVAASKVTKTWSLENIVGFWSRVSGLYSQIALSNILPRNSIFYMPGKAHSTDSLIMHGFFIPHGMDREQGLCCLNRHKASSDWRRMNNICREPGSRNKTNLKCW
jgi:hypothetical protein